MSYHPNTRSARPGPLRPRAATRTSLVALQVWGMDWPGPCRLTSPDLARASHPGLQVFSKKPDVRVRCAGKRRFMRWGRLGSAGPWGPLAPPQSPACPPRPHRPKTRRASSADRPEHPLPCPTVSNDARRSRNEAYELAQSRTLTAGSGRTSGVRPRSRSKTTRQDINSLASATLIFG